MDTGTAGAVTIRRIRPEDGELLREARVRGLADSPDAFGQSLQEAVSRPADEWDLAARQSSLGDRRAWYFAERDTEDAEPRVVGIVQGRRRPPHEVMVFSMWVEPAMRRLGIGRALIEAVEGWASTWRGTTTVLWVFGGNEPAIRFYQRLGFRLQDSGPDADAGAPHGALAMRRSIGPVPATADGPD
jgi:GNAT superfamily N-acetyltransferase